MKSINVFTFLGVIVCGSVLALVSAATTADTTMDGEITEVSTPEFSATNTDFEPYYCTVGTCSGTDNSCLKTLESTCKITDDANGCQVSTPNARRVVPFSQVAEILHYPLHKITLLLGGSNCSNIHASTGFLFGNGKLVV
ncbi:hypothetical protein MAR_028562 [Mya arenaria]|uniref:Uncharacterized protein n=1 Tax=Mya arenaria TaxID=6604 RepID=A0ABY7DDZ6_MYAAR|nr:hypothetical protein MAR_028562 [Mya arenaria]